MRGPRLPASSLLPSPQNLPKPTHTSPVATSPSGCAAVQRYREHVVQLHFLPGFLGTCFRCTEILVTTITSEQIIADFIVAFDARGVIRLACANPLLQHQDEASRSCLSALSQLAWLVRPIMASCPGTTALQATPSYVYPAYAAILCSSCCPVQAQPSVAISTVHVYFTTLYEWAVTKNSSASTISIQLGTSGTAQYTVTYTQSAGPSIYTVSCGLPQHPYNQP